MDFAGRCTFVIANGDRLFQFHTITRLQAARIGFDSILGDDFPGWLVRLHRVGLSSSGGLPVKITDVY